MSTTLAQKHPYHLVDPSPWPLFASLAALVLTLGAALYMHGYSGGGSLLSTGFALLLYTMFVWWRDVIRESTFQGHHTSVVELGLRYGVILFIVSEIMFFVAFFWNFLMKALKSINLNVEDDVKSLIVAGDHQMLIDLLFQIKKLDFSRSDEKPSQQPKQKNKKKPERCHKRSTKTLTSVPFYAPNGH